MYEPRKRILRVEDNEDICFMLTTVSGQAGYDTASATRPADALEMAGLEHFDLYILDTRFGGESGLDLCRALRAAHLDTPVVFYSAAVFDADREAALRAGARAYVTKPGTDELMEAVRDILSSN